MSWIKKVKCFSMLLVLNTLLRHANSFVLCDDEETACPSNYICCKRDRGYYCCYKTMYCCNNGRSCCEIDFLGREKNNLDKPKIAVSLIQTRNQVENNNSSMVNSDENHNEDLGLVTKISEDLDKIKELIGKNLRQIVSSEFKRIEELVDLIKSSINDTFKSKFFESHTFLIDELEKVANGFLNEFKESEFYKKLVDLLSNILKYINSI